MPRPGHTISRANISDNALKVLYRLKEAGFQAFLVGGSVRDLLLGLAPKDFDVATDALPEEVRNLFRNCRLIGRRFRLAHVYFGREIVEVATFRAALDPEAAERGEEQWLAGDQEPPKRRLGGQRVLDERGRILRDNVYGTIEEDVWRRDFTTNALYYNIQDLSIWDFVGGYEDVMARRLRLIGDPLTRYHEDPVRMLRAVRFAAKLNFTLDESAERPLPELAYLLAHVPPARLFDETLKLFLAGFAASTLALLRRYGLLEPLLPMTHESLERDPGGVFERLLARGLEQTDERVAAGKPVTPSFLFALLFYGPIMERMRQAVAAGAPEPQAMLVACEEVVRAQQQRISIPRRFILPMREMYMLQLRFRRRAGRKAAALVKHPRFRAAYDFLLLRAAVDAEEQALAEFWTGMQSQSAAAAAQEGAAAEPGAPEEKAAARKSRTRRRRRGSRAAAKKKKA